jgi:hypothetical protein
VEDSVFDKNDFIPINIFRGHDIKAVVGLTVCRGGKKKRIKRNNATWTSAGEIVLDRFHNLVVTVEDIVRHPWVWPRVDDFIEFYRVAAQSP